jgi:hypothetical protein
MLPLSETCELASGAMLCPEVREVYDARAEVNNRKFRPGSLGTRLFV